jgi:hypothetical protein
MNTDIVRKIKHMHVKATGESLATHYKFFLFIFLFSLLTATMPHISYAQAAESDAKLSQRLVFDTGNTEYQDYLDQLSLELADQFYRQQMQQQTLRRQRLTDALKTYLEERNSPLAPYSAIIVTLRNWKKIIALSNAESTLCKRYPVDSSNCWGVGGANLWDMGSNLGEGVIEMNKFLNNHPRRSHIKYAVMPFEDMNGLYKQPAAQHWVDNNTIIYDQLVELERSIQ